MRLSPSSIAAPALVTLALFALPASPALADWPSDPNVNVPISLAANTQNTPVLCTDGAGGAIVAWQDFRNGTDYEIYVQRVSASGATLWTADGVQLTANASRDQTVPQLISDGAGGAIITWQDARTLANSNDIYAQRVNANGVPQWAAGGVVVSNLATNETAPQIVTDGSGGAIIAWQYYNGTDIDLYAQRLSPSGTKLWSTFGNPIANQNNDQVFGTLLSDGAAGGFLVYDDYRSGTSDIYAQRITPIGGIAWGIGGVPVTTITGSQNSSVAALDGAGGVIATWLDGLDVYAARITASGTLPWIPLNVCNATGTQTRQRVVGDGAGGAYVTWQDPRNGANGNDIYAQHVLSNGAASWTTNGVAVASLTLEQTGESIVSDGAGGATLAWNDTRSTFSVYAQHLTPSGVASFAANGIPLSTALSIKNPPALLADGAGGVIACWGDARNGATTDLYAQRLERFGQLGNPEPKITKLSDVTGDQGSHLAVEWTASYLDAYNASPAVTQYSIWRRVPTAAAMSAIQAGARLELNGGPGALGGPRYRATSFGAQTVYWEWVTSQPSHMLPGYSYVATTTTDSSGTGNPRTSFMVSAETAGSAQFWNSAADSGYSVDNLPPAAPAPFTGQYAAGVTHLHWNPNSEADLAGYRLYRGTTPTFTPGPATLVTTQPDTGYADAAGQPYYYKLSATDVHGNESAYASLTPTGTTGVGGGLPLALSFAGSSPNPSRDGAVLHFALPRAGLVRLSVFDAQGRSVRELANGMLPAGEHALPWDGRLTTGAAAGPGLYFARLAVEGRTLTRRFVLTP